MSLSAFSEDQFDKFFDAIIEFIKPRGLEIGGGGSKDKFSGYVTSISRYDSATDDDRGALEAWLINYTGTSEVLIQPLSDAYHGTYQA